MRRSRRLAAGMSPREVARAEQVDEAEIQGLLRQADFAALVESWHAIDALPQAEQIRRLVVLARQAIEQVLCDWDVPAAFFVLRENERGRDPAETIANGIIAAARRRARAGTAHRPHPHRTPAHPTAAGPAPTGRPRRAGDLARRRQAARATAAEHAIRHAASDSAREPPPRPTPPASPPPSPLPARPWPPSRPGPAPPCPPRPGSRAASPSPPARARPAPGTEPLAAGPVASSRPPPIASPGSRSEVKGQTPDADHSRRVALPR